MSSTTSFLLARRPLDPHRLPKPHSLSDFATLCPNCSAIHFLEERTYRSSDSRPRFAKVCCMEGKVDLALPSPPPEPLSSLFTRTDLNGISHCLISFADFIVSKSFLDNIRAYNNAFSFASLGAKFDTTVMGTPGVYTFRIYGQLYHLLGSLLPRLASEDGRDPVPRFSQIYMIGPDSAQVDRRMAIFSEDAFDKSVVRAIQYVMSTSNPYLAENSR